MKKLLDNTTTTQNIEIFNSFVSRIENQISCKKRLSIVSILEESIKIFNAIERKDDNDIVTSLCSLFVECVKCGAYSNGAWDDTSFFQNDYALDEVYFHIEKTLKNKLADFLKSDFQEIDFILEMIAGFECSPFKCIDEFLNDGSVILDSKRTAKRKVNFVKPISLER